MTIANRLLALVATVLSSAVFAAPLSDGERDLIVNSARKDPTGWGSQETVNLVSRLAREGNLEGLDLLLSLNHASLLGVYTPKYRESHRNEVGSAIEVRLLQRYDDARIATTLMWGLDKYGSKALLERLLADASKLAAIYAEEAKHCKVVIAPPPPPSPPREQSGPQAARPMMGSTIMGMMVARDNNKLECEGPVPQQAPERSRMAEAVRMLGRTDLPDAPRRIQPLFVALTVSPPVGDTGAFDARAASRIRDLDSIAELWGRERFVRGGADLIAVARKMPGRSLAEVQALWPALKALGQMDLREGSETIAEWIDRRSSLPAPDVSPTVVELIRLLGPVLPEGQIDVAALRERVLARASPQNRTDWTNAFKGVEASNRNLRDPTEGTLVSWARANSPRMVRYLLSRGITPNARDAEGETAITASRSYFDMQKLLVEAGANPDLPGRDGLTPFHLAVAWFNPGGSEPYKVVDYFYSKKADVNRLANQGTPLVTAAERSAEMVKYLLERGARVDIPTREGMTPLHAAARGAKAANVRMLLAAGASVSARDRDAMMPLHYAVRARSVEIAELLIERGADVNAEVQEGMTPLLMAQDNQDAATAALIERRGGRVNLAYVAKRAAMKKIFENAYRGH